MINNKVAAALSILLVLLGSAVIVGASYYGLVWQKGAADVLLGGLFFVLGCYFLGTGAQALAIFIKELKESK